MQLKADGNWFLSEFQIQSPSLGAKHLVVDVHLNRSLFLTLLLFIGVEELRGINKRSYFEINLNDWPFFIQSLKQFANNLYSRRLECPPDVFPEGVN